MKVVHKNTLLSAKGKPRTAQLCTSSAGAIQVCTIGAWRTKQPYVEQCGGPQNTHPTCQRGEECPTAHSHGWRAETNAYRLLWELSNAWKGDRSRRSQHLCFGCLYRVLSAPVTIFPHSWFLKIRIGQFSQGKTNTWKAVLSYIPWFTKGNISGWQSMLRSGKRSSLCPDPCKERFWTSASSKQYTGMSGAWPKAKNPCCGKQTPYLHWRGWWAGPNLPYFRSQTGMSFKRQRCQIYVRHIYYKVILQQERCWPPLQWPGAHMPQTVPQSKLPRSAGDNMRYKGDRAGISLFNCTIGSFLLFLLLCLGKSGEQGLAIWASTRAAVLYRHLCLAGLTPKTRHKATRALYFWAPPIHFEYFSYKTKEKAAHHGKNCIWGI